MTLQDATDGYVALFARWSERSTDSTLTTQTLQRYQKKGELLAIMDDEPCGFIAFRLLLPEVELDQILLHESARGRGIAKQALSHWHSSLKEQGATAVFLEVRAGNNSAVKLYDRLGYEKIGLRKSYYTHNGLKEDAILMRRSL
jgi:ribosomal-protein-alanine N-acetyltransferase